MAKSETIKIQDGDTVIELTGSDKEAFLAQRALDQIELETRETQIEARKQARLSALQKLGLNEEEINAIL